MGELSFVNLKKSASSMFKNLKKSLKEGLHVKKHNLEDKFLFLNAEDSDFSENLHSQHLTSNAAANVEPQNNIRSEKYLSSMIAAKINKGASEIATLKISDIDLSSAYFNQSEINLGNYIDDEQNIPGSLPQKVNFTELNIEFSDNSMVIY